MAEYEGDGMNKPEGYFRYWGKADPKYPGQPKWHPLVYHCLNLTTAAVNESNLGGHGYL